MSTSTIRTANNDYYLTVLPNLMESPNTGSAAAPLIKVTEPVTLFKLFQAAYFKSGSNNTFFCTIQQVDKSGTNRFYTYMGKVVGCCYDIPRRDAVLDILYSNPDLANTKYQLDTYNQSLKARVKVLYTRVDL